MSKKKSSLEDRQLTKQIEDSLKVSSYVGEIANKIQTGANIVPGMVPNYKTGESSSFGYGNESGSMYSIDLFNTAAGAMGIEEEPQEQFKPETFFKKADKIAISAKQYKAIQKYPSLIEYLGGDDSDQIAGVMQAKVNEILAEKIGQNSKECSKFAFSCKASKQNIEQFFVGENQEWACRVIASGPFKGNEAIYYKADKDKSFVLRKIEDDFQDVSKEFNLVHEFAYNGESNE